MVCMPWEVTLRLDHMVNLRRHHHDNTSRDDTAHATHNHRELDRPRRVAADPATRLPTVVTTARLT
ncbi:hypothetical protein GCM10023146_09660 [Nocardioides caricicola]